MSTTTKQKATIKDRENGIKGEKNAHITWKTWIQIKRPKRENKNP